MLYSLQLTVEPLIPITTPSSETLKVTKGKVNKITVLFPPGCCTLVGVWFEYHTVQILPWARNKQLFGAGNMLEFSLSIPIDTEPYEVIVYGYSEDDTFDHTVYITVNVIDEEASPVASFGAIQT